MKTMKIVFGFIVLITGQTFAASAFEDGVPQVLVEQFTSGQIYSGLPVDFPQVDLPDSITVRGSLDNDFSQMVVFSSAVPVEEASMDLAESFENSGWTRLISQNFTPQQNGFIYPDQPPQPLGADDQFCHDRYGTMTLTSSQGSENFINLRLMNQAMMQPGFSCQQQNQQRQMQIDRAGNGPGFGMPNQQYLPRLEMPEGDGQNARPRSPFFGLRGISGSSNDFETQASISGDWSVEELNQHFADQLQAQGWQLDSDWAGEVSAGGNWTINPEANTNLIGILTVLERTQGIFELKFRLVVAGANTGNAGIILGGQDIIINRAAVATPAIQAGPN